MPGKNDSFHNNFFIEQFSIKEFATSFFQEFLPERIKREVNWKKLKLAPGDFVQKALRNRRSDILYETEISGRKGFFYLHLEHQRKPDLKMALRMLEYMLYIIRQHEKQYPKDPIPLVFPMVLFQGTRKWNAPFFLHELLEVPLCMRPYIPEFQYELLDLSHLTDSEIQGTLVLKVGMLVMKHIDSYNITDYFFENLLPLFNELSLTNKTGIEYLESTLYYLFNAGKHFDTEQGLTKLQTLPDETKTKEVAMTLAEKLIRQGIEQGMQQGMQQGLQQGVQQGMQQGLQQGVQQGILEGECQLVFKQLKLKFGKQAENYEQQIRTASLEELDQYAERILTANKIEDIF